MPHWQTIVVFTIVLVAAAYLAYRGWLVVSGKKSSGCGSGTCCTTCGKSDESSETGLVTRPFVGIDELQSPRDAPTPRRGDTVTR
jgi:hypothetical protein